MKTSVLLRAAKALIDTPDKWTKGEFARTKTGRKCKVESSRATCFCSLGAIERIPARPFTVSALRGRQMLKDVMRRDNITIPISVFNDSATHDEVMKLFDRAIALAEEIENEP